MNKLYSEGLVDPEVFTMTQAAYNAKVKTSEPTCGVISIWDAAGSQCSIQEMIRKKEWVYTSTCFHYPVTTALTQYGFQIYSL